MMTAKTDVALAATALAVAETYSVLTAILAVFQKQLSGHSDETKDATL
jgi:hypothetical protein